MSERRRSFMQIHYFQNFRRFASTKRNSFMKIYLAGPLFTLAEIDFNLKLASKLVNKGFEVFLPQQECQGKDLNEIFTICVSGLDSCDVILANVDGSDADSGTSWECGYAYAKNIPVVIYRTDIRVSGDMKGFNAMIYFAAKHIIEGSENYFDKIVKALEN